MPTAAQSPRMISSGTFAQFSLTSKMYSPLPSCVAMRPLPCVLLRDEAYLRHGNADQASAVRGTLSMALIVSRSYDARSIDILAEGARGACHARKVDLRRQPHRSDLSAARLVVVGSPQQMEVAR